MVMKHVKVHKGSGLVPGVYWVPKTWMKGEKKCTEGKVHYLKIIHHNMLVAYNLDFFFFFFWRGLRHVEVGQGANLYHTSDPSHCTGKLKRQWQRAVICHVPGQGELHRALEPLPRTSAAVFVSPSVALLVLFYKNLGVVLYS